MINASFEFNQSKQLETCRHCNHWNDHHMEGNVCKVWMGRVIKVCGCPKWESLDNLLYLENLSAEKSSR